MKSTFTIACAAYASEMLPLLGINEARIFFYYEQNAFSALTSS